MAVPDAFELRVRPAYNMFGFGDTAVIGDLIPTLPVETRHWVSVTAAALLIESPQRRHPITLRLERFNAAPPEGATGWEVTETVVLHLPTGRISVNAMSSGQIRGVRMPGPGDYRVRISGRNRRETAEADRRLYQGLDIDDPAFSSKSDVSRDASPILPSSGRCRTDALPCQPVRGYGGPVVLSWHAPTAIHHVRVRRAGSGGEDRAGQAYAC